MIYYDNYENKENSFLGEVGRVKKNTHKNIISAYSLLRCSVSVLSILASYIISIIDHIHIINDICYILRKREKHDFWGKLAG